MFECQVEISLPVFSPMKLPLWDTLEMMPLSFNCAHVFTTVEGDTAKLILPFLAAPAGFYKINTSPGGLQGKFPNKLTAGQWLWESMLI